jgi:transcriptional regulator of arginine metabolism
MLIINGFSERNKKMKYKRQGQILKIIKENEIKTHEQLIEELNKAGFSVTQATVSRDIKEMGIIKVPNPGGGSIYSVASGLSSDHDKHINIFSDTVREIDCAMHTVVVKTYPGMASAVAASVDSIMKHEFLGSIAGDDTLLIIASDEDKAMAISEKLRKIFNSKGEKNA